MLFCLYMVMLLFAALYRPPVYEEPDHVHRVEKVASNEREKHFTIRPEQWKK